MTDILDIFRRQDRRYSESKHGGYVEDIFFCIGFNNEDRAILTVVDKKGNTVDVDYRNYTGNDFQMLRSMDAVKEAESSTVMWGGLNEGVRIDQNPQLMYQLIRCGNLVSPDGAGISLQGGLYQVNVDVYLNGDIWTPAFRLQKRDGDGPYLLSEFKLLTDSYALSEGKIVELMPLGDEVSKFSILNQPFRNEIASQLLSVMMSHFDNIYLSVDGKPAVLEDVPMKVIPAIVFEKVTEDNALFLRLTESIPGVPLKFVEDFSPVRIVTLTPEGEGIVRNVDYGRKSDAGKLLEKQIRASAPSRQAAKEIYKDDGLFIIPEETAGPFLINQLPSLARDFMLIGSESLSNYKIKTVMPKFAFTGSSGIDFLEGFGEVRVDDYVFQLSDFLAQYRKNHYIELSDGEKGIVDEGYVRKLERLFNRQKKGKKMKLSFFDMPELESLLDDIPDKGLFRKSREFYAGFNALNEESLPKIQGLKANLRPYQEMGVKWMKYLYQNNLGGCLADDMGLGKTIQAIAMLQYAHNQSGSRKPSLVVMPRTLIFNWISELSRFAPKLKVSSYYGADRDLEKSLKSQIILTTYALVRNDIERLKDVEFNCIILDESQNIKNLAAKAAQAVMLLKADHRFALSGTPLENRLSELYSLFRFLNPGMFGSAEDFNQTYVIPVQKEEDKEVLRQLKSRINPFLLRRVKEDVLKDLPERINQTIYVEMEEAQAQFYEMRRRYYYDTIRTSIRESGASKSQFLMFQALSELRRIASVPESLSDGRIASAKIPAISDALSDAVENGHKVVVFFNFIAGIELLGEELERNHISYAVMTGATSDRQSVVERFQNDPVCRVLLMTLKTGGVGLNLTAADTVFIAEPWWNKAAEEQAVGRLHRMGQKSVVHSFSVITSQTIEERILQLQQQKSSLVEALISSDSSTSKALTEEDIDFILG